MTLTNKILIVLLVMITIGAVGFIIYQQHQMQAMQQQLNSSVVAQKQLLDNITRSQAGYVSKADLDAFAKQNSIDLATIRSDLSSLNATITGINQISVSSGGEHQNNLPSTNTIPNPDQTKPPPGTDPFGYLTNQQVLKLDEPFGKTNVPIGDVGFSAWQKNPWNVNIYPRTYNVTNVLGTDPDGKQYVYNKFTINSNGKTYPLTIANAKFEQELPSASLSWFNPRLFIGADAGLNLSHIPLNGEFTPNLSIGVVSYGKTKANPDLSILQVGVGYGVVGRSVQIQVSPIQYNIGQHLNIIRNTYLGPVVGIGVNGDVTVGAGLRVGL